MAKKRTPIKFTKKQQYNVTLDVELVEKAKELNDNKKLSPILNGLLEDWVEEIRGSSNEKYIYLIDELERFRKSREFAEKEELAVKLMWVSKEMGYWLDSPEGYSRESIEDYKDYTVEDMQFRLMDYEITFIDNLERESKEDKLNPIMESLRKEVMVNWRYLYEKTEKGKLKEDKSQ